MADNIGVLGSSTAIAAATATVYTCPANKAAKFRLFGALVATATPSNVSFLVNGVNIATVALGANGISITNGGAGLFRASGAAPGTGVSAAETAQPAPPIYYLSAGQTVQFTPSAALSSANIQVVGVEIDLTA